MVIWLIGMSGSGKTTIAQELIRLLRRPSDTEKWVLIDGDIFRNIMGEDVGHSIEERKKNADRICALCSFLDKQGINVLACVLSIFHESQDWLQNNINGYKQVYIKVNYEILKRRDNKQLYERAERGEIDNVVGVQIPFPEPKNSTLIIHNNFDSVSPLESAKKIIDGLSLQANVKYRYTEKDLLKSPIKYQYLPFEGREFLRAYRENRQGGLIALEEKMEEYLVSAINTYYDVDSEETETARFLLDITVKSLPGVPEVWSKLLGMELLPTDYRKRFFSNISVENCLITREYLVRELGESAQGRWDYQESWKIIFTLLQRFEVSKKIYTTYSLPDIKKTNGDFSDLLIFPLLHHLLIECHKYADDKASLVLENSILKLGDLIISIIYRLISPAQMVLTYSSIRKELQIMERKYGL